MSNILITGSTGFLGRKLCEELERKQLTHIRVSRTKREGFLQIQSIDEHTQWAEHLSETKVVVHAAARVHMMQDNSSDPLAEYRNVNTLGTLNLAIQAAKAGVKRFIFISSIKVSGEETELNKPYKNTDQPKPVDPYGISKYEAEQGLKEIVAESEMELVIIRPTLIYGPGVRANFLNLMKLLSIGIPLPLGSINNKRSLVSLGNLVDLIITCIDHPSAVNETFLISDDRDVSTTELLNLLGKALGKKIFLLPIPMSWLTFVASLIGKRAFARRLCGSLQVDIKHTKKVLNWEPPISLEQGLLETAEFYKKGQE